MFLPDIMLIDGKRFHGSTSYVEKHETLRTIAGSGSWFTEFQPVRFPDLSPTPDPILSTWFMLFFFLQGVLSAL